MPRFLLPLLLWAALWLGSESRAASPPTPLPGSQLCANTNLAVTTASARIILPSTNPNCPVVGLLNDGTTEIFVALGTSSVVADTTGIGLASVPIPAGGYMALWTSGTYVAAITAANSSTLRIMQSNGPITAQPGGSGSGGGGGGASTIANGADVAEGATTDSTWAGSGNGTVVAILKYVGTKVEAVRALLAGTLTVATHAVTQSGAWNITNVTGTVSLPTGAAQESGHLATVDTSTAATSAAAGTTADTAWSGSGNSTIVAALKAVYNKVASPVPVPSSSAAAGIAPSVSGPTASSLVLKASAGNLYGVYVNCTSACWLMVFNSATAPSNGAVTAGIASGNYQDCIPISAGGFGSINYSPGPPEVFSVGITAMVSSTACGTLTAAAVGLIHGSVM